MNHVYFEILVNRHEKFVTEFMTERDFSTSTCSVCYRIHHRSKKGSNSHEKVGMEFMIGAEKAQIVMKRWDLKS